MAFAVLVLVILGIGASSVQAATLSFTEGTGSRTSRITFRAAAGEVNRVTVTSVCLEQIECDSSRIAFRALPRPRVATRGCTTAGAAVSCDTAPEEPADVYVFLGDQADTAAGVGALFGQGGNDRLTGDSLDGGLGADLLTGRDQRHVAGLQRIRSATLTEGDSLTGGLGNDRLRGRLGFDRAMYSGRRIPVRIDLRRAGPQGSVGERDVFSSVEEAQTGSAADILVGGPGENVFSSGAGNDAIGVAGGGADWVFCGAGTDQVRADAQDRLIGCERVTRVP